MTVHELLRCLVVTRVQHHLTISQQLLNLIEEQQPMTGEDARVE